MSRLVEAKSTQVLIRLAPYVVHKLLDALPADRGVGDADGRRHATVDELLGEVPASGTLRGDSMRLVRIIMTRAGGGSFGPQDFEQAAPALGS